MLHFGHPPHPTLALPGASEEENLGKHLERQGEVDCDRGLLLLSYGDRKSIRWAQAVLQIMNVSCSFGTNAQVGTSEGHSLAPGWTWRTYRIPWESPSLGRAPLLASPPGAHLRLSWGRGQREGGDSRLHTLAPPLPQGCWGLISFPG